MFYEKKYLLAISKILFGWASTIIVCKVLTSPSKLVIRGIVNAEFRAKQGKV